MGRGSPTALPHPSDDEESIVEEPESVVVDGRPRIMAEFESEFSENI
jgi:hypothetical protein